MIAAQLAQGVTFQRILDNIRDSVAHKLDRSHLATRKDIANIERAFGLQRVIKHPDDATSVAAWVREMDRRGEANPVLLYKAQGQPPPPDLVDINETDFILVIQTPIQGAIHVKAVWQDSSVC